MTIYFSIIIIIVENLDYLQKHYKITWLRNTFSPRIRTKICNCKPVFFTGCMKRLTSARAYILIHVFGVRICLNSF